MLRLMFLNKIFYIENNNGYILFWSSDEMPYSSRDHHFLKQAILAAQRSHSTYKVGAVIVRNDEIVTRAGRTYRDNKNGTTAIRHAEYNALVAAGTNSSGATLYTTLEPCCYRSFGEHHQRLPTCLTVIAEHDIARVVVGIIDENPRISGESIRRLQRKGVSVTLAPKCVSSDLWSLLPKGCRQRRFA